MKRIIIAAVLLVPLAGCAGQQLAATAAAVSPAVLTPAQLATVQADCAAAAPALAIAVAPDVPASIRDTAVYPKAYCDQLAGGAVPPTTDANTPSWLPTTLSVLAVAAKAAGIILPLLL